MKLKVLQSVLYSTRDSIQFAIVYDSKSNIDIENGCSVECAIQQHGDKEVKHIQAFENQLVITI